MLRTKGRCFSKVAPGCSYSLWKWQPEDLLVNERFCWQDADERTHPEQGAETESRRATCCGATSPPPRPHGAFNTRLKSSFLFRKGTWRLAGGLLCCPLWSGLGGAGEAVAADRTGLSPQSRCPSFPPRQLWSPREALGAHSRLLGVAPRPPQL